MEYIAIIVPLIVGLSKVLTQTGVDKKWIPLINIGIGLGFAFLFPVSPFIQDSIMIGIMAGLGAGGFYDLAVKPIIK